MSADVAMPSPFPDPTNPAAAGSAPIVVVEPHGDDALLALGWTIRRWVAQGHDVTIVTVFWPEDHRAREAEAWADHVGARWIGLDHRNRAAARPAGSSTRTPLPDPLLPAELRGDDVVRLWPLGFGHPDHRMVGACAPEGDLRYIDTPYQQLPPLQDEALAAIRGTSVVWWCSPDQAKWDDATCFPSQAGLFRAFSRELGGAAEIVVSRPASGQRRP